MDHPPVEIRLARSSDAEDVAILSGQLGYRLTPSDVIAFLPASPDRALLVAEASGRVVGWIEVARSETLTAGNEALICGLVVDEAWRGQGIGQALVRASEAWATERGLASVRVRSRLMREAAHRFYLRLGYAEYKRQIVFVRRLDSGSHRKTHGDDPMLLQKDVDERECKNAD